MYWKQISKPYLIIGLLIIIIGSAGSGFQTARAENGANHEELLAPDIIRAAVETWVQTYTPDPRIDTAVALLESYEKDGSTWAYIAHLTDGGYCLCGASELVLPVYFYSPQGTYDPRNPNCRAILREIADRTRILQSALNQNSPEIAQYLDALSARARDWNDLARGRTPPPRDGRNPFPDPVAMELELTCEWDQPSPYNDHCPAPSPIPPWDEHVVVGCNQVAMAQTMYYWKWPAQGEGTHTWDYDVRWVAVGHWVSEPLAVDPGIPSNWPVGAVGEAEYERLRWNSSTHSLEMTGHWDNSLYGLAKNLSTDTAYLAALGGLWNQLSPINYSSTVSPGTTFYDWAIMPHSAQEPPGPGEEAIARLCFHVGATSEAAWGLGYTCGCHADQATALKTNFRYDDDAKQQSCDMITMVEEIQWIRPVGMGGGSAEGGGHAWVIHGYDANYTNWRFLMNMGWGGGADGWYTLDNVPGEYHLYQSNLIHVAPLNVRFVGDITSGDGSPNNPYKNIEEALAAVADYTTLIFKADSVNTFSSPTLVIDKPLLLKGEGISIE